MKKCLVCNRDLIFSDHGSVNAIEFDFNGPMGICGFGHYGSSHDGDMITISDANFNEEIFDKLIEVDSTFSAVQTTKKKHPKRVYVCDDCIDKHNDKFEIHIAAYGTVWKNAINDNKYNLMSLAGYNNIVTPICKECLSFNYKQIKSAYAFLEQYIEINKYWDIQKTKDSIKFKIRNSDISNYQYFCEGKVLIIPTDIRDMHLVSEADFKRRYKLKY